MKKILVSFGDSRLKKSAARLKEQAEKIKFYDRVCIFDENNLSQQFRSDFHDKLTAKLRGFGYWCWKPQIILQVMQSCDEGDIIQYIDVGCHLNQIGLIRLQQYFEKAKASRNGILAFQAITPIEMNEYDGRNLPDMQEKKWAKADLIHYFGLNFDSPLLETQTIAAGVFFMVKNEFTIKFLEAWIAIFKNDFSLIDDTPSKIKNQISFIEHRHDQSIFSIMCKLNSVECVSFYETWMPDKTDIKKADFKMLEKYPIHVRRDKPLSLLAKIKKIINRLNAILK